MKSRFPIVELRFMFVLAVVLGSVGLFAAEVSASSDVYQRTVADVFGDALVDGDNTNGGFWSIGSRELGEVGRSSVSMSGVTVASRSVEWSSKIDISSRAPGLMMIVR